MNDREAEISELFALLRQNGIEPIDASHNEMAKMHARYLVGGRKQVDDERLFRFSFPERPGALAHFLHSLSPSFNVSLFHYRNYGGDVAKVMVGIQVPGSQATEFDDFLFNLKYPYVEETFNPIYQNFLR